MVSSRETQRARLTRLVQHVALNESGWWERALERLTLACAYSLGPSTRDELCEMVNESSGLQRNSNRLLSSISRLLDKGHLVVLGDQIRVAEAVNTEFHRQEEDTLASEDAAYRRFERLAQRQGLGDRARELWSVLEEDVVLPLIEHMGARAYGLINPSSHQDIETMSTRIEKLVERHGTDVRDLFGTFIDPTDDDVRAFVLRRLNAQYVLTAGALPEEELDHLAQLTVTPSRIDIFLDTNFLLSILGLHNNPSNAVAVELLDLVEQLKNRINLKLYVLPITVDETRRVVRNVSMRLSEFRPLSNIARAASRITSRDLVKRYFEQLQQSPTLTPDDFFHPYDSGLVPLLRAKSVELYNTDLSSLRLDQEVIDDVLAQEEYQSNSRPDGPKPYDANLHDMVLWHFSSRHRAVPREHPLEVPSWIVTIDYGFIRFDKYKQRAQPRHLPLCLHPSSLIYLFQFWVPSSTRLDEALVGSLRQPLLFLDFDIPSEQVTLRILAQLSQYANAENLDSDVAAEILTNTALRERIASAPPDRSADEQIVREVLPQVLNDLGEQVLALRRQLDEERQSKKDLQRQAAAVDSERSRRYVAERALRQADDRASQAVEDREELSARVRTLEDIKLQYEDHVKVQEEANSRRTVRRQLVLRFFLTLLVAATSALGGYVVLRQWIPDVPRYAVAIAVALLALVLGTRYTLGGTRFEEVIVVKWLFRRRPWLATIAIAVVVEVVAGVVLWALGVLS